MSDVSFAHPQLLWLVVVPLLLIGWELAHRRRRAAHRRGDGPQDRAGLPAGRVCRHSKQRRSPVRRRPYV